VPWCLALEDWVPQPAAAPPSDCEPPPRRWVGPLCVAPGAATPLELPAALARDAARPPAQSQRSRRFPVPSQQASPYTRRATRTLASVGRPPSSCGRRQLPAAPTSAAGSSGAVPPAAAALPHAATEAPAASHAEARRRQSLLHQDLQLDNLRAAVMSLSATAPRAPARPGLAAKPGWIQTGPRLALAPRQALVRGSGCAAPKTAAMPAEACPRVAG